MHATSIVYLEKQDNSCNQCSRDAEDIGSVNLRPENICLRESNRQSDLQTNQQMGRSVDGLEDGTTNPIFKKNV